MSKQSKHTSPEKIKGGGINSLMGVLYLFMGSQKQKQEDPTVG